MNINRKPDPADAVGMPPPVHHIVQRHAVPARQPAPFPDADPRPGRHQPDIFPGRAARFQNSDLPPDLPARRDRGGGQVVGTDAGIAILVVGHQHEKSVSQMEQRDSPVARPVIPLAEQCGETVRRLVPVASPDQVRPHLRRIEAGQQCEQRHRLRPVLPRIAKFKRVSGGGAEIPVAGAIDKYPAAPRLTAGFGFRNQTGDRSVRRTARRSNAGIAADFHPRFHAELVEQRLHRFNIEGGSAVTGEFKFAAPPQRPDDPGQQRSGRLVFRVENPRQRPGSPHSAETAGLLDQQSIGSRFGGGDCGAHSGRAASGDDHVGASGDGDMFGFKFNGIHDFPFFHI